MRYSAAFECIGQVGHSPLIDRNETPWVVPDFWCSRTVATPLAKRALNGTVASERLYGR